MKSLQFKAITPHIVALVIFVIVSLGYFSPEILEGKKLKQHDIITGKAMQKEIVEFREKTGEEALWTNSMFSGMPAYQISVSYFSGFLNKVRRIFELWIRGLLADRPLAGLVCCEIQFLFLGDSYS